MQLEVQVYRTAPSEWGYRGAYHLRKDCRHIEDKPYEQWTMTFDVRQGKLFHGNHARGLCGTCLEAVIGAARTLIGA